MSTLPNIDHSAIAQRAYEIYLKRGSDNGDPQADWLLAETELRNAQTQTTKKEPLKTAPKFAPSARNTRAARSAGM